MKADISLTDYKSDYGKIDQTDEIEIQVIKENIAQNIAQDKPVFLWNKTKNVKFELEYNLSNRARDIILAVRTLSYVANKR